MKIHDELDRQKRTKVSPSSNIELFDSIKPLISNTLQVWDLVDHFFNSEIFNCCSIFQKNDFYKELINFIGPKSYPAIRSRIDGTFDYIFIGTLLVILRISSLSIYNAGYEIQFIPFTIDSIDLAQKCYEKVKDEYHHFKLQLLQFILILDFYHINCPEEIEYIETSENSANFILVYKLAMGLGLNLENKTEYLQKIWYYILELDTNQFLREGNCSFLIRYENYTTELPDLNGSSIYTRERFKCRELIEPLASLITNMRSNPTIKELDSKIQKLEEYLLDNNFNSILSKTDKVSKTAKFLNFIDISSLIYMVLYHIFLHYTGKDTQRAFETVARLLSISNPILQITHFLDSTKEHQFNLQQHFGSSTFCLIPKILNVLHKFLQLQVSLMGRTNYIPPKAKIDLSFDEIKRISFQNARVIIANFGRIANQYFYAKRMNMIQTVLFVNTFGTSHDTPVAPNYLKLLDKETKVIDSKVLTELVELNLQSQSTSSTSQQAEFPDDHEDLLDVVLDQESIEQLEQMLNAQSFLN